MSEKNTLTILTEALTLDDDSRLLIIIELIKSLRQDFKLKTILGLFTSVDAQTLKQIKAIKSLADKLIRKGDVLEAQKEINTLISEMTKVKLNFDNISQFDGN